MKNLINYLNDLNLIQENLNKQLNFLKLSILKCNEKSNFEMNKIQRIGEKDSDFLLEEENILDELINLFQLNQTIINNENEINEIKNNFNNKINEIINVSKQNNLFYLEIINEKIDNLIELKKKIILQSNKNEEEKLKEIEIYTKEMNKNRNETLEMKTKREIKEYLKQIEIQTEKNERNLKEIKKLKEENEKQMKKKKEIEQKTSKRITKIILELKEKTNDNLTIEEILQIEEWTKNQFEEIIFDSNINNWNKNTSEFDSIILNKEKVIIVIEDKKRNIFGCFLNDKISLNESFQSKEFLFSLKRNGKKTMKKYERNNERKNERNNWGFTVFKKESNALFTIGENDICILKKNNKNKCYCNLINSNELFSIDHLNQFEVKRIFILKMK